MEDTIAVHGARLHNLKNVSVDIPKNRLVVLTGLSGSGKSTLAFDTLHKEGQTAVLGVSRARGRRPEQAAARPHHRPVSVDQRRSAPGQPQPRSTVGTATEVYTYLRVLYARIGHRPCPACGADVPPSYDPDAWD